MALSRDGQWVATAGEGASGFTIDLWNTATGAYVGETKLGKDAAEALAILPDLKKIVCLQFSGRLIVWNLAGRTVSGTVTDWDFRSDNSQSAITADGSRLAIGNLIWTGNSYAWSLSIWDSVRGRHLRSWTGVLDPTNPVYQVLEEEGKPVNLDLVSIAENGSKAVMAFSDGAIKIVSIRDGGPIRDDQIFDDLTAECSQVALSPDGLRLIAHDCSRTNSWDIMAGKKLASSSTGFVSADRKWTFLPDGIHAIGYDSEHGLVAWNVFENGTEKFLNMFAAPISNVFFDRSSHFIYSANFSRFASWGSDTGQILQNTALSEAIDLVKYGETASRFQQWVKNGDTRFDAAFVLNLRDAPNGPVLGAAAIPKGFGTDVSTVSDDGRMVAVTRAGEPDSEYGTLGPAERSLVPGNIRIPARMRLPLRLHFRRMIGRSCLPSPIRLTTKGHASTNGK